MIVPILSYFTFGISRVDLNKVLILPYAIPVTKKRGSKSQFEVD